MSSVIDFIDRSSDYPSLDMVCSKIICFLITFTDYLQFSRKINYVDNEFIYSFSLKKPNGSQNKRYMYIDF